MFEYPFFGDTESRYLANKWNSRDKPMIDVDTGRPQINFVPQDDVIKFTFSFYFSKSRTVSGRRLADANNRCFSGRSKVVRPNTLVRLILSHVDAVL